MKKRILWVFLTICLSVTLAGIGSAEDFEGSVTINPDDPTINLGEDVTLTADWGTNKDVTRYEWVVDGNPQGEHEISDKNEKQNGQREMTYSGVAPGDYTVCFAVWHHRQTDRYAEHCVTITVNDQMCTWFAETAWADGNRYNADGSGNWATYTPYDGSDTMVYLLAGQTMDAGTVNFSVPDGDNVTITIELNDGWRFKDDSENVKIQDYDSDSAPSGNPSPGQFIYKYKATESSFSIQVPLNAYYGVHVDVERCEIE